MFSTHNTWLRALAVALTVAGTSGLAVTQGAAPAQAQTAPDGEVDRDTFYRELSPYGKWFEHPRWGEVWRPDVENDWRPYTRGHWAWTDDHGWYWVAEEEWGWAPFHYGRWVFDDDEEEWLWIPGTEWAPAWVQWRESENHIGWAPLPPDSVMDGDSLRFSTTYDDSPRYSRYWVFAPPAMMIMPGLYRHIVAPSRYSSMWRSTRRVQVSHRFDRGRMFHPGIDHRRVERWAGRPLPVISLRPVTSSRDYGWRRMRSQTEVPVFRPRIAQRLPDTRETRPAWGSDRRDGRGPRVDVTPRRDGGGQDFGRNRDGTPSGRDGNRDGGRDGNRDGNRDSGRDGDRRRGDGFGRSDNNRQQQEEQARRQADQARQQQEQIKRQQEETARRQTDQARQQQEAAKRQQEDAARRQADQARQQADQARQQQEQLRRQVDTARQQQEAARRQQEDAARRQADQARQQADQARQQQEQLRRQGDAARQQQEAAKRQQDEAARRQAEQARQQQPQGGDRGQGAQGEGRGRGGEGRGGEGRSGDRRGGEGRGDGRRRDSNGRPIPDDDKKN